MFKQLLCAALLILGVVNTHSQVDYEYQIKNDGRTGLRLGYVGFANAVELGVAQLLIDKPCNRSTHRAFGPSCSFPKRFEVDGTLEYYLSPKKQDRLFGQRLSVLYTLLAWQDTKNFQHKSAYYTIGHTIYGVSAVHYSNSSESRFYPAFEVGWMSPHERLGLFSHSRLQLNVRIVYTYNMFLDDEEELFGLRKQTISAVFTLLKSQRHQ